MLLSGSFGDVIMLKNVWLFLHQGFYNGEGLLSLLEVGTINDPLEFLGIDGGRTSVFLEEGGSGDKRLLQVQ